MARALMSEPKLLLLDEDEVGPDATARQAMVPNRRQILQTRGMSVLGATPLADEVAVTLTEANATPTSLFPA